MIMVIIGIKIFRLGFSIWNVLLFMDYIFLVIYLSWIIILIILFIYRNLLILILIIVKIIIIIILFYCLGLVRIVNLFIRIWIWSYLSRIWLGVVLVLIWIMFCVVLFRVFIKNFCWLMLCRICILCCGIKLVRFIDLFCKLSWIEEFDFFRILVLLLVVLWSRLIYFWRKKKINDII